MPDLMIAEGRDRPASSVLIVEDVPTQAELARLLVTDLGYDAMVVATGQAALETARSLRPAAVLLDMELPDFDGFELLRRLRAEGIDSAVIVITANASMEAAKDAIRAGAFDYLVKPFRRDRLGDVISRALTQRASTASPERPAQGQRHILLVEKNALQGSQAAALLAPSGYAIRSAASAEQALDLMTDWLPDAILLDADLPGMSGLELLGQLAAERITAPVIMITDQSNSSIAAQAIKLGALDYLAKPYDSQRLAVSLRNALRQAPARRERYFGFIGASAGMKAVYSTVESAAPSRASVFITGESGTGKELAADAVHRASPRARGPFIALNCGAIPRDLLESEVFGHVRGAFTGATGDRTGAARLADGGTLFLDEIAEMPLDMQVKLLRFIQTGTFQPVGSGRTEKVDVRFVCATNRDPMSEVQAGRFREDLFYRLYVVPIELPPLRERGEDVVLIARHFLQNFAREEQRRFRGFTVEAERLLLAYAWPGNVRQLQNVVRNIVVLNDAERVDAAMLPPPLNRMAPPPLLACPDLTPPAPPVAIRMPAAPPITAQPDPRQEIRIVPLAEMEKRLILAALQQTRNDVPRAAALLEVNPSTIYRKLQLWRAQAHPPS